MYPDNFIFCYYLLHYIVCDYLLFFQLILCDLLFLLDLFHVVSIVYFPLVKCLFPPMYFFCVGHIL